jgi:alkylhydroperoxidase family enzyme
MSNKKKYLNLTLAFAIAGGIFISDFYSGRVSEAQRIDKPRIPPVQKADWTDAQRELLPSFDEAGTLYNVYTTMANHPDLMRDWIVFASHVLRRSTLPEKDRETLILRIGWLCQSEYEWAQHVRVGKCVGLTDIDIARIIDGPDAKGLSKNTSPPHPGHRRTPQRRLHLRRHLERSQRNLHH